MPPASRRLRGDSCSALAAPTWEQPAWWGNSPMDALAKRIHYSAAEVDSGVELDSGEERAPDRMLALRTRATRGSIRPVPASAISAVTRAIRTAAARNGGGKMFMGYHAQWRLAGA
ncbi:hypothetical protein EJB05_47205 [Eragrostis curvula]|uniref:Uncharacterized protein n=2 Tax=Eragrostis curvula TaxID=38414 RepID=A0A5J9T736_9POAL|nr:hypothetical protein EJB05_47205 [Eragrostis curvula]